MSPPRLLPLAALATLVAALPVPADACDCVGDFVEFLAPPDGGSDVPTNTRLWIGAGTLGLGNRPEDEVALHDPQGRVVTGRWTVLSAPLARLHVFTPTALLEPRSRYTVEVASAVKATFHTGDGPDDVAPAVPVLGATTEDVDSFAGGVSSCGEQYQLRMEVTSDAPFTLLDRARTSTFAPD
ncbi:MAG: hypothetical protein ACK4N5_15390, partial [Myxococcales bacterium]